MRIDALDREYIKVGNHDGDGVADRFYINQHTIDGEEPDGQIRLNRGQLRELRGWIDTAVPRDVVRATPPQGDGYKVGDIVEIVEDEVYSSFKGRRGVIKDIVDGEHFPFVVQFFDDDDVSAQNASEIKLVTPKADPVDTACEPENAEEVAAIPHHVSDSDKLRLLDAVVDAQPGFGTDLADFKRRLQIVLGL